MCERNSTGSQTGPGRDRRRCGARRALSERLPLDWSSFGCVKGAAIACFALAITGLTVGSALNISTRPRSSSAKEMSPFEFMSRTFHTLRRYAAAIALSFSVGRIERTSPSRNRSRR